MPDTPTNDDEFADLFRKLPDNSAPRSRREARQGAQVGHISATDVDLAELLTPAQDSESHARHRRERRKSRIAAWSILLVILAVIGGVVAGGFWVWNTYETQIRAFMGWEEPKDYEDGLAEGEATVTIISGDTGASISQTLYHGGVTKTPDAFYSYLIETARDTNLLQPGVYVLQQKMTSAAAFDALTDPANRQDNTVLITEGMTWKQAVAAIAAGTDLDQGELEAAVADATRFGVPAEAPTIEGFLFPATYSFDPDVTVDQAIQRIVDETFTRLDNLGVAESERFSVLTLAALVQKESGPSEGDMNKIARVFLNRIDEGMPLQSDATVAYGTGTTGTVWTTDEERADASNPYNTYVHLGLPPGPISNPGEAAIKAALTPATGDWLYFVAVDLRTGETIFSNTHDEHLAAVEKLRQWCRVAENAPYCA